MHVSCLEVPRAQGHIDDIKAKYGESSNAYRVIALVREKKPEVYMRVVADLLPKEATINVEAGEAFVNLWQQDQRRSRGSAGGSPR